MRVPEKLEDPNPSRSLKLGHQLLGCLCVISLAVALAAGYFIRDIESSYLTSLLEQENQKKFDLLVLSVLENVISEDVPQIETMMKQLINRDQDVRHLRITNNTGKILFRWDDVRYRGNGSAGELTYAQDITLVQQKFGKLQTVWDASHAEHQAQSHAYTIALALGAVCFVLGLLFYAMIGTLAITPIRNISERVERYRSGDFATNSLRPLPRFASLELSTLYASVNSLRDFLTQNERTRSELKSAKDYAESANRAKSKFLANMSHELRTPLNAINGFSEMMMTKAFGELGNPVYETYAENINQSGVHLTNLINDILDLSKIEAGKASLYFEELDVVAEIQTCVSLMQPMADTTKVRLETNLAKDLPTIPADSQRVRQVVLNMLSNAVKFSPEGGLVCIGASFHEERGIIVTTTDNGIGIKQEDIARILEPFEQIESTYSRQHAGSGLGLPVSRAFIELHGGVLTVESEVGAGTCVTFNLPIVATRRDVYNSASETESDDTEARPYLVINS